MTQVLIMPRRLKTISAQNRQIQVLLQERCAEIQDGYLLIYYSQILRLIWEKAKVIANYYEDLQML